MNSRNGRTSRTLLRVSLMILGVSPLAAPGDARAGGHERVEKLHPGSKDSAAVAATVNRFRSALAAGDTVAALELLAPDATILESGDEESRTTYAAHHLAEDIAFARTVPAERGPLKVIVVGDVAWVSSLSTSRGTFNGRAVNSAGAELIVLSRSRTGRVGPGPWKIRAIHWSSHRRTQ